MYLEGENAGKVDGMGRMTGWLLSPVLASAAMSLSSVSVVANSLRLRRFRPTGVVKGG